MQKNKTPDRNRSGVLAGGGAGQLIHIFRCGLDYAFIQFWMRGVLFANPSPWLFPPGRKKIICARSAAEIPPGLSRQPRLTSRRGEEGMRGLRILVSAQSVKLSLFSKPMSLYRAEKVGPSPPLGVAMLFLSNSAGFTE